MAAASMWRTLAKARSKDTEIPADVANLEGPVLGFFGVVDERMDYDLVG
jgi:hypothetical protein